MNSRITSILALGLLLGTVGGCESDKPHKYGKERPSVDQLDERDAGLQSKDVIAASEQMAADLLANVPELHNSQEKWVIVVTPAENYTSDTKQNLNLFVDRLGVRLRNLGHRDIQLVENRDRFHDLQARELEGGGGGGDQFGQGSGYRSTPGGPGLNPDFDLYAKISELRNRGTSYYYIEFRLTAIQNTPQHRAREIVWTNAYEVKVNN